MNFRKIVLYLIIFISTLVVLASLLSLFYNLPYWYSKLLDFPRVQYLIVSIICFVLLIFLCRNRNKSFYFLAAGLLSVMAIQTVRIYPYLFGEPTVASADQNFSEEDSVGILLANVLISNNENQKFLKVIEENDPDIIIAMEVNKKWLDDISTLKNRYPFSVEQPNEVAYGMAVYSKLPLENTEIKYLKHKNVPSIHAQVQLKSGKQFMLYAVHPVAPMPSDKYPDNVGEAEKELLRVGKLVSENQFPSIVAGDFNDVSWSNTSRLFEENGKLNNVRIGRGLYNTFDANSAILRWPLDHYYVTKEFQLAELKRLDKIGSDHFPIFARLVLKQN